MVEPPIRIGVVVVTSKLVDGLDLPDLPGAVCKDLPDPEIFFSFDPLDIDAARRVCHRCPAIRACLAWALDHEEPGIWAGTTAELRAQLRRDHRKASS